VTARPVRALARGLAIAVPAAAGAIGLAMPGSVLWGGLAWLGFLLVAFAGWGHAVERLIGARIDLGLRLAWGLGAVLAVSGGLLAFGALDRTALLALLGLGFAGQAWRQLTADEPVLLAWARGLRGLARDPQATILWGVLVALALVNVLRAVARVQGNHFDDDIAYTPMVKRLLDIGDLDEPFSFRRLSAFGGQTILSGFAAARGTLANLYLADHGVGQLTTLALLVGLLRKQRPLDRFVAGLVLLVTLLLPDASTNTASYWTGTALFLGLYRTLAVVDELPRHGWAIVGGLAAAACSLRQNYVPVAVLFPAVVLALRLRGRAWRDERRAWRDVVVAGAVGLVPFAVASWHSSHTFLYPLWLGTGNPHVPTTPLVWNAWQELQFFLGVVLDPNPVRVMVPLVPVVLMCRDRRAGAPLVALTIACAVGFVLLVHAFTLSDARNLWRYGFGYVTTLALVVIVETTGRGLATDDETTPVAIAPAGRVIVIACLLAQFVYTAKTTLTTYRTLGAELVAAHHSRRDVTADLAVPALYQRLQHSVPARASLVALLDDAAYLDYARNRIFNLDTPGFASAPPGLPMFVGAEAKAAYFRARGLRYLAFVRGDHSRYFYRRAYWMERIFWDTELWRVAAAYQLDLADSFLELTARYRSTFDEGGLVVLDLETAR